MTDIELTENSAKRLASHYCPNCEFRGGLKIIIDLQATPFGTYSLAGHQDKIVAREIPVLVCEGCNYRLKGEFDGVGHVYFNPPTKNLD